MLEAKEYLPVGSVVLLNNGIKELMIIGIMASREQDGKMVEADYLGVYYPEGYNSFTPVFMFNQRDVNQIVFRGYDGETRSRYVEALQSNMDLVKNTELDKLKIEIKQ